MTRTYPTPDRLRNAALADIGFSQPLAETIRSVAQAICDGSLSFGGVASLDSLSEQLSAIPEIDEDVIQYIAMRVLGEPDLDLAGNRLLHRNGFGASNADYSPMTGSHGGCEPSWRSYAALYRWTAARFATTDRQLINPSGIATCASRDRHYKCFSEKNPRRDCAITYSRRLT